MLYFIDYANNVERQLSKLDKTTRIIILKKIKDLETNPTTKGKHLYKNLYELKYKSFRVYYTVLHGVVIINKITYQGKILIKLVGKKNTQKMDIKSLKW